MSSREDVNGGDWRDRPMAEPEGPHGLARSDIPWEGLAAFHYLTTARCWPTSEAALAPCLRQVTPRGEALSLPVSTVAQEQTGILRLHFRHGVLQVCLLALPCFQGEALLWYTRPGYERAFPFHARPLLIDQLADALL